jgi:hypothetical protein
MFMECRDAQYEILKKMSPQQKLEASMNLYHSARKLKAAWLSQLHSDWSEEKIKQEVREAFVNARS